VLVTGSAGFVGSHLVPRLEADGHEVVATDREVDVTDAGATEAALARARPDAVVHLAAQSSPAASWRVQELTFRVNYLGAHCVLGSAARVAPRARLLVIGSADAYGPGPPGAAGPLRETDPLRPRSPYARSKAAADLLAGCYARRGLDVVRVRPFNSTGPGQSDQFVAPGFARQLAEIEAGRRAPVLQVGNLDSVRDFLDIQDVVDAYVRLLDRGVAAGVYNVASGIGVRIGELLEQLLARTTARPAVESDSERQRPTDAVVGDASRLRAATGWAPRVPLGETLDRLLGDWRSRVSAS
jgi:GDP-4-dehydro-6-deoxy-D-mannose reductase